MKESAVFDKPYIKKSAWIGVASLPEDFCQEIKKFSGRELPVFASREDATAMFERSGFAMEAVDMPQRPYTDVLYLGRKKPAP